MSMLTCSVAIVTSGGVVPVDGVSDRSTFICPVTCGKGDVLACVSVYEYSKRYKYQYASLQCAVLCLDISDREMREIVLDTARHIRDSNPDVLMSINIRGRTSVDQNHILEFYHLYPEEGSLLSEDTIENDMTRLIDKCSVHDSVGSPSYNLLLYKIEKLTERIEQLEKK